jgi:hypothetical protein
MLPSSSYKYVRVCMAVWFEKDRYLYRSNDMERIKFICLYVKKKKIETSAERVRLLCVLSKHV